MVDVHAMLLKSIFNILEVCYSKIIISKYSKWKNNKISVKNSTFSENNKNSSYSSKHTYSKSHRLLSFRFEP